MRELVVAGKLDDADYIAQDEGTGRKLGVADRLHAWSGFGSR